MRCFSSRYVCCIDEQRIIITFLQTYLMLAPEKKSKILGAGFVLLIYYSCYLQRIIRDGFYELLSTDLLSSKNC